MDEGRKRHSTKPSAAVPKGQADQHIIHMEAFDTVLQSYGRRSNGGCESQSFDFMLAGMEDLLVRGAPIAERRDGLGFEDRVTTLDPVRQTDNGEVAFVLGSGADKENSMAHSISINDLEGLAAPAKQRGVGRPTNSREKAPYEGLSRRTRFCSICRRGGHKRTTCPDRGDALKKPRKPGRCKNCGIEGHRQNTCTRPLGFTAN